MEPDTADKRTDTESMIAMDSLNQITSSWSSSSTLVKVAMVAAGCLVLFVAFKVGHIILKLLFGLVGLALLGWAVWWFCFRP
jgi:hypothetical protein